MRLDKVDVVVKERCGSRKVGANKEVELSKQNSRSSKSGPQKYPWKSAKVARKLRERRAKAEVPNQRPLPHELNV